MRLKISYVILIKKVCSKGVYMGVLQKVPKNTFFSPIAPILVIPGCNPCGRVPVKVSDFFGKCNLVETDMLKNVQTFDRKCMGKSLKMKIIEFLLFKLRLNMLNSKCIFQEIWDVQKHIILSISKVTRELQNGHFGLFFSRLAPFVDLNYYDTYVFNPLTQ